MIRDVCVVLLTRGVSPRSRRAKAKEEDKPAVGPQPHAAAEGGKPGRKRT